MSPRQGDERFRVGEVAGGLLLGTLLPVLGPAFVYRDRRGSVVKTESLSADKPVLSVRRPTMDLYLHVLDLHS